MASDGPGLHLVCAGSVAKLGEASAVAGAQSGLPVLSGAMSSSGVGRMAQADPTTGRVSLGPGWWFRCARASPRRPSDQEGV